ncbi:MAG: hypothetical protein CL824_03735, partial [Crocinitomicaceae bacterium]|nr:hypothetical protein [Crocinitomicaceae bacterium]
MKKLHILCFFITLFLKSLIFAQQGTLVLPTKDYIQTDSLVSFSWNKYLNADEYQVEIDTNISFPTPLLVSVISNDTAIYRGYGNYFWRVNYLYQGTIIHTSQIRSFEVYDLNSFGTLKLWLDAGNNVQLNGLEVDSWQSSSANGFVFSPASNSNKPELFSNVLNNNSALYFDGSDNLIGDLQGSNLPIQTLFAFFSLENAPTSNMTHIFGRDGSGGGAPIHCLRLYSSFRIHPSQTAFNNHFCNGVKAINSNIGPTLDTIPWAITTQFRGTPNSQP